MVSKHSPVERQEAIRELIQKKAISDQKHLVDLLKSHYGIDTNQAVVSRDLRKLGVVKKMIHGTLAYDLPLVDVTTEILRLALVDISHNESMIVIKTHPALADFVGDCVDQYTDLEVLGCLSGENTVLVVPKSVKNIHKTCATLCDHRPWDGLYKHFLSTSLFTFNCRDEC
jgi:transcriptional regulator of arginine metabolism